MSEKKNRYKGLKNLYEKQYKKLLLIPIILLVLAITQIGYQTATTGDFVNKGVALKGGITISIPIDVGQDLKEINKKFSNNFPEIDISVRELGTAGSSKGIIIDADINTEDDEKINNFLETIEKEFSITKDDYSIDVTGASLGKSFFQETLRALAAAFLFMGAVVFLYFGKGFKIKSMVFLLAISSALLLFMGNNTITATIAGILGVISIVLYSKYSIPSVAVVLAAFSDIIITLSIINLIGIKMSTAGIAAFLMLIGYSVDTDILLSTRVLKRKEGSIMDRIYGAMKTGLTMNTTTIAAIGSALIFTQSDVIRQIMVILIVGLLVDIINTWIQNVGILRLYLEKKNG